MEGAVAWIGKLAEWLGSFIPRWVILDTTEAGIKYVRGQPCYCAPGQIHWYWPVTTVLGTYPVVRQTDRLETQTLESSDGKTFMVSGTLTYCVDDIMKLVPTTHLPLIAVVEIAGTALHDVLCDLSWEEIQAHQRKNTLKTRLKNEAQRSLTEYGVTVLQFKLNTLARCRVFKVSQTTASEEN